MFTVEKWSAELQKIDEIERRTIGQVLFYIIESRFCGHYIRIYTEIGTKVLIDQFEQTFVKEGQFYFIVDRKKIEAGLVKPANLRMITMEKYFAIFCEQTGLVVGMGDAAACENFLDYINAS